MKTRESVSQTLWYILFFLHEKGKWYLILEVNEKAKAKDMKVAKKSMTTKQ